MIRLDRTENANSLSPEVGGFDDGISFDPIANAPGRDRHDLAPILAVIRHEIDRSAAILRDLAERLSHELCTLGVADETHTLHSSLLAATVALQNEDRIQQRLCDLGEVLSVLERTLAKDAPAARGDLDQAIIESLRLEEMRNAFAVGVGMVDAPLHPSGQSAAPSIGDIDLF